MSTGDFYYLGSSGAYNISDTAAASQQNAANFANVLGVNSYNGLLGTQTYQGMTSGTAVQYFQQIPFVVPETVKEVSKSAKRKLKGVLANLRSEIDGWHGDVLERCPA